ncbi:hypothetical protein CONCODRAFT_87780 [Conidiobolus coronatus NRRL 28638]|uniref:PHD-type domain-containing protein n=1 Tax=Conidiobolus coronatus (strain ATCC 28846 / CBS 209.66 / NRRL 28638) TaxID=796925 RepID=A0A137NS79_CONC2|nr:hypothetical protein CONCODRAFT_87780 [Conidiobolus coronatus NRRL 28638]|eukprot:KXN65584.1 hypothetical protein CONCODRAFT_87780 [Conidiobolus coronatus NRRL 28638]
MSEFNNEKEEIKQFDKSFKAKLKLIEKWNIDNNRQKKEILKSIQDYIDNYDINTEAESLAILSNIVEKLQVISRSTIDKLKISQDSLDLVNELNYGLNQAKLDYLLQDNILTSDPPSSDDSDTTLTSNHSLQVELSHLSTSKSHRQTRKITNHDSTSSDDDLEEEQISPIVTSTSLKRTREQRADSVNSDEVTYCYCKQISYGEMVACDGPDCEIEWFHYPCVDLRSQPKGKWYCRECSELLHKEKQ